jgi:ribosomal protein L3 glutamine methyltransferase
MKKVDSTLQLIFTAATIRDYVRLAVSEMVNSQCFYGHGVDNALDEAIEIVTTSLSIPSTDIELFWDAKLRSAEADLLNSRIKQRIEEKIPTAYLTGKAKYAGYEFVADSRALIPRSLLINAFDVLLENADEQAWPSLSALTPSPKILDLCCGGASIAISVAHRLHNLGLEPNIVASDLSLAALAQAKENIALHSLKENIKLVQGDLFSGLKKPVSNTSKFDLIFCNPPYVNAMSMKRLPSEYLHEPQDALASGIDGMEFIERLLTEVRQYLKPKGQLLLEIGHEAPNFENLIQNLSVKKIQFEFAYCDVPAGENMVVLIDA